MYRRRVGADRKGNSLTSDVRAICSTALDGPVIRPDGFRADDERDAQGQFFIVAGVNKAAT